MINRLLLGLLCFSLVASQAEAAGFDSCGPVPEETCCCSDSLAEQTCSFGCLDPQTEKDFSALSPTQNGSKRFSNVLVAALSAGHNILSSGSSETLSQWTDGLPHAPPRKKYLLNCTFLC